MAAPLHNVAARTWSAICYDMPEDADNEQAVEVVMDADYAMLYGGRKEEVEAWHKQIDALIKEFGYDVVLKGLSKHIQLV